jgi:hypothetical protein
MAVLILGSIRNANGAEHSVGNAALMVVLATGAGYADGVSLPLLLSATVGY